MKTIPIFVAILMACAICAPASEPLDDITAGRFTTAYSNAVIYVGTTTGDALTDIIIFYLPKAKDGEPQKEIRAKSGAITERSATQVSITLNDARISVTRTTEVDGKLVLAIDSDEQLPSTTIKLYRK